jgi:Flp pilus assembly protein TadD
MAQRRNQKRIRPAESRLRLAAAIAAGAVIATSAWLGIRQRNARHLETQVPGAPAESTTTPPRNETSADPFIGWLAKQTNASELLNTGTAFLDEGRAAQAIACYRRALELRPVDEEAQFNLGVAHTRLGQVEEAERAYRAALEIFPEYVEARNNLGNVLTHQKRYSDAEAEFALALKIAPDDASAHNNLGRALAEQGKIDDATKHFVRAVELDGNYFEARFNLGSAYMSLRKTNEALAAFEEAHRMRPGFPALTQALNRLKPPTK